MLADKIPCHDSSCQIGNARYPCTATGVDLVACADTAANMCAAMAGCVAFGVCKDAKCTAGSPWVEFYNGAATSAPLDTPDWNYYFNETALGPAPAPAPECVPGPSTCKPAPAGSIFPPPGDYPPGCNHKGCTTLPGGLLPKWEPTYQMNLSTLIMPCNNTGRTDPASTKGWAYVDFDWSNWKGTGAADGWAKHKPMDCEELMVEQVKQTVAASPGTKAFVYRNMIKALPWFTSVREKLTDPAYGAWFMNFSDAVVANHSAAHVPVCDANYDPPRCSNFYHDQSQTPGYPHGDGNCAPPGCDVGSVPVGEYLFEHRNANVSVHGQTFVEWFVDEYFGGPAGIGNENIIGFYIDDDWGNMNAHGPSEMESHAMQDMGLGPGELADIVTAYNWVAKRAYEQIVARGKWSWDLFLNNDPNCINCGDCPHPWVSRATCAADLRAYGVNASSPMVTRALLYGFSPGSCSPMDPAHLTEVDEDVANFLLVRGDYAYLGNGWLGCSRTYEFPEQLNGDYGEPLGRAAETAPGSSVFVREFSKSTVQMDCNTYTPTITFK